MLRVRRDGDEREHRDGGATTDASSTNGGATDGGPEAPANGGAFCAGKTAKLCADFEGRTAPAAKWNGTRAGDAPLSALAIVPKEDPFDSAFLRVTVPALAGTEGGWSLLVHNVPGAPASLSVGITVRGSPFAGANEYVEIDDVLVDY